jgi:FtsP/CotA-like multicopper oxidase with cupredoxin domain
MTTGPTRMIWSGLLLLVLVASAAPAHASAGRVARPTRPGYATPQMICTDGPTFNLRATTGDISTPDGNSIFMWGFGNGDTGGEYQDPGPILCVTEGDTVTVTLSNDLPEKTSIVFPGQTGVTTTLDDPGVPGLLTAEAAPGETVTYTFLADHPGTFLYESGTEPDKQVQMGLYGALVVRPLMGVDFAYDSGRTQFSKEFLILMHDIDPFLHHRVEVGRLFKVMTKHDRYWTINGRSFPDTISDNYAPWLPSQPYGALVQLQPYDDDPGTAFDNPLPVLIRMANASTSNHPFHPHGNHLRTVARDGHLLEGPGTQDTSMENFTRTMGAGQTADLIFKWTDVELWDASTNQIPVRIPRMQNLVFKDDATWYSGSPYLGRRGRLPVGVTSFNECGEFWFPWHSHALNEFVNFDEGFGGLATLIRVDPPGGCP